MTQQRALPTYRELRERDKGLDLKGPVSNGQWNRFERNLRATGSIRISAGMAGFSESVVTDRIDTEPEFAQRVATLKAHYIGPVAVHARKNAITPDDRGRYDSKIQEYLLSNHLPSEYSRNPELLQSIDTGPKQVNVILGNLTPERVAELREMSRQILLNPGTKE